MEAWFPLHQHFPPYSPDTLQQELARKNLTVTKVALMKEV
jgi:hypothetical protein